ncbi:MAG TPA: sugar transferase [Methylomirabilota bacterium]|nr:sugar transferase [Methylomirabilota bacterium]
MLAAFTAWSPADTVTAPPWVVAARLGVVVAVCATAFYYNDLYDFEVPHDFAQLFTRLARALGLSALALAVTYVLYPPAIIGGNFVSMALPGLLVALLAVRGTVYVLARRPAFSERVVLLGGGALAAELAAHIHARPDLAARLVGVLAPSGAEGPGPRLGAYGDLQDVVRRYRPDRIIVALPDRRGHLPVADLLACRVRGIHIEEGTRAYERFMRRLAVETLAPSALVFGDGFRVTRIRLAVKRLLSVAVALAGLWVAAPLMAAIALAIKLESRGPVFFVQERVGLHGRPFRLVKFRTMREAVPAADGVWERDNASRVTRLGAVLRKYRLDELPQFINILRGDMSLVGPRPEMAGNIATFSAVIPFYNLRHEVRPGLTGWAQVKAGYSMSTEEVTRKLCYDLYYIKHLSLAFDLQILLDTVKFVLSGKRPG